MTDLVSLPFFAPVPRAYVSKFKVGPDYGKHLVGSGPYTLKSYTKGQQATFVANKSYWQAGQPYLDELDFKVGVDDNAAIQQIEAGTLDLMGDPLPPAQFTDVTTNPAFSSQVQHATIADTDYVFMDTQQPNKGPFSKVQVRQAVNYALDRKAINEVACLGFCPPTTVIVPRVMDFALQTPGHPYDPQKAKQLLTEAGYPNGLDAGEFVPTPPFFAVAETAVNFLNAVRIKTRIKQLERAAFYTAWQEKKLRGLFLAIRTSTICSISKRVSVT